MGKKSKKKNDAELARSLAQDIHQTDQAAVWSEQVPNALAHLRQRSCDWLCPGLPASQLISNGASWVSAGSLAIAFVFAKLIFSRKAEKTPKRDAEWEAYMEGLKDDARARGVAFPEDAAKAPALTPQTSMLAAKSPKASEPPLVETTEFSVRTGTSSNAMQVRPPARSSE